MKCLRTAAGWAFLGVVLGQTSCGEPDAKFANGKKRVASSAADSLGDLTDAYLEDKNDHEYAEYTPVDVVNFCNIYPRVTVAETLSFPATAPLDNGTLEHMNILLKFEKFHSCLRTGFTKSGWEAAPLKNFVLHCARRTQPQPCPF